MATCADAPARRGRTCPDGGPPGRRSVWTKARPAAGRRPKTEMKARFYCANCGTEVPPRTDRCPQCGKFFRAVTCPKCGFEGDVNVFLKGCPVCGYLVNVEKMRRRPAGRTGAARKPRRTFSAAFYRTAAILLILALAGLLIVLIAISR